MAYNNEGAYAFCYTLEDFRFLDYDFVLFVSGYNDLGVGNSTVFRHANPVFRTFGYMPILPLIAREKIMVIKSGGQLEKAYRNQKIVFRPKAKEKIKIIALDSALKSYNKLEDILNRLKRMNNRGFDIDKIKADRWSWYKHFMKKAIDLSLSEKKKVIVITGPYINQEHIEQQEALRKTLLKSYPNNQNVLYQNLGDSLSLNNLNLAYDGMHLTQEGSKLMADAIAARIKDFICPDLSN